MANKVISVLHRLRGDTLANLESKNAVYDNREPIIVEIPADASAGTPAAILLKVGDGVTAFKELPYASALAGDVSAWAKAATKPTYAATEITGIDEYISGKVHDTNTKYKLEQDATDAHTLKLYSKELADTDWTLIATIETADTIYTAADGSLVIDADNKNIKAKISEDSDNALELVADGLKVEKTEVSVAKKATATSGYIASYQITVNGVAVGVDIDIPKDYLVKSAEIKVVETENVPYDGAVVGDKYIDFTINTVEGSGNVSNIYLPVQDLVDEYTSGNGIDISATNEVSVKLGTNQNGLVVSATGLELGVATDTAAGAMSAADHTKLTGITAGANKVEKSDTNGNVKVDGEETVVYTLPSTVLDSGDTLILDGGNA